MKIPELTSAKRIYMKEKTMQFRCSICSCIWDFLATKVVNNEEALTFMVDMGSNSL